MFDRLGRISTALFIIVLGAGLIWLALPRMFSGLYVSNYGKIYNDLSLGKKVSNGQLALAAKGHVAALQWLSDGKLWARLGEIRLAQAKAAGFATPEGQKFVDASIEAQKNSLRMRPSQPYTWTQYAHANLMKYGNTEQVDPLLRKAVSAGPYEPNLVLTRVELGFVAWPHLSKDTKDLLNEQIRLAARYYPDRLARATKQRHALKIVRNALRGHSKLLRSFASIYLRL